MSRKRRNGCRFRLPSARFLRADWDGRTLLRPPPVMGRGGQARSDWKESRSEHWGTIPCARRWGMGRAPKLFPSRSAAGSGSTDALDVPEPDDLVLAARGERPAV